MTIAIANGKPVAGVTYAPAGATGRRIRAALDRIAAWHGRARGRRQLARMAPRGLADIGITRADVCQETHKWFWQA